MKNPDREEWQILDLFGNWVPAPSKAGAIGCVQDGTATALRLASSVAEDEPEPVAWADKYGETHPITAESKKTLSNNPTTEPYWSRFSIPLYAAPPADAGMREAYSAFQRIAADCHRSKWQFDINAESPPNVYDARRLVHKAFDELQRIGNIAMHERDELPALTAPGATTKSDGGGFQDRVRPWMLACFGPVISFDKTERNHRFLEEALELVQSIGCTQSEAHQLVDYVFGRPVGDPVQEVGGVMVTLAALCLANDLDMAAAGETELARIWTKVEAIRAKQAAKPKHSPLPGPSDPSSTRSDVTALADIAKERQRQRDIEGWTVAHDDGHDAGEMASAAACYALSATGIRGDDGAMLRFWPWDDHWWKPTNRRRDLIKAGALIVAEIERLDRLDQFEIRRTK